MRQMVELLIIMGLMVGFVGCAKDNDRPTGPLEEITARYEGQPLEAETEIWDNGKVTIEYQYFRDQEGKMIQHGWYKRYDETRTLRLYGTYFEGKENYSGKWVGYDESGKLIWEQNYEDGKRTGKWLRYDESGTMTWEANYVDGKLHGREVEHNSNGKVINESSYVHGILEGKKVTEYYENGEKKNETNYLYGRLDGKSVGYYES